MTGHLLVPALDPSELATVSPAITRDCCATSSASPAPSSPTRSRCARVADTVGMVEGFVQALLAGADAIETGAQDYPDLVEAIPAAVVARGRRRPADRDRLEDAARRTAAAGRAPAPV